jgi:hypothetical protein
MPKCDGRWIPPASFESAEVALLNSNLGSERFLRQLGRQSPNPNVFTDEPPNIHFGMRKKNLRNFYTLKYIITVAPTNSAR